MNSSERVKRTYKLALIALLAAQALALAYLESLIPLGGGMPQGIKLGISNIIVMYTLGTLGIVPVIFISIIKSLFAGLTRGFISMLLSLSGGLASVLVMSLLSRFRKIGFAGISIAGAVTHNLAQLMIVSIVTYKGAFFVYTPVLIVSGIIMGIITGTLLSIITPLLDRQGLLIKNNRNGG